ncbi:MAG: hypothetical protein LBU65_06170 [Planctomycetaceae bacterium]|jgi:tetratricopeptide (TPR) repeat protein|nr:hypothetical protein [Planctomycetaceae bacterium]
MRTNVIHLVLGTIVTAVALIVNTGLAVGAESALIATYAPGTDSTNYIAVGLKAPLPSVLSNNEVVFIVDTSAAQYGESKTDSVNILTTALRNLPVGTKVKVYAVDLEAEPLTDDFVSLDSQELNNAVVTLANRVPLGATNLGAALDVAESAFDNRNVKAKRNVVLIGSGNSNAKQVTLAQFKRYVSKFTDKRIPVSACAVGARTNLNALGALVNQTGGVLLDINDAELQAMYLHGETSESNSNFAGDIGTRIANAVTAAVVWTHNDNIPETWQFYPISIPPIRSDRDTILVAKTPSPIKKTDIQISGVKADGSVANLTWSLDPQRKTDNASNAYLAKVVDIAQEDDGITMPIVGREMLAFLSGSYAYEVNGQLQRALYALDTGSPTEAITIANDVLKTNPNNKDAKMIISNSERMIRAEAAAGTTTVAEKTQDNRDTRRNARDNSTTVQAPERAPKTQVPSAESAGDGEQAVAAMVDEVIKEKNITTQKMTSEVSSTIGKASKIVSSDPESAIQELKLAQTMVRNNTSLDPDARNQLLDRLGQSIKQASVQKFEKEVRQIEDDAIMATQRERMESLTEYDNKNAKAVQILNRYSALIEAKEYAVAERAADIAVPLLPNSETPATASLVARTIGYVEKYDELRMKRHRGTIDALMVAEESFIPVPEEPPILYPDPETWLALSTRRKERFSAVSLSETGEAEQAIQKALDKPFSMEITDATTFQDLFDKIRQDNSGAKLNIILGKSAIDEQSLAYDSTVSDVTTTFNGVKLRSVLKRLLAAKDCTYCIQDEMLIVETIEEAKKVLSLKVYPVADLVIPTENMGSSGGGYGNNNNNSGYGNNSYGNSGNNNNRSNNNRYNIGSGIRSARELDALRSGKPANGYNKIFDNFPADSSAETSPAAPQLNKAEPNKMATSPVSPKTRIDWKKKTVDATEFWKSYFAGTPNDAAVKEAVYEMLIQTKNNPNAPKDKEVVALIYEAINSGHLQSWMYEALAISLYRSDAPKKEIERAAMSAAAFASEPMDLLTLAVFLQGIDLYERAFDVYREVIAQMPLMKPAYKQALKLANLMNTKQPGEKSEEALRWITLAIASQEWSGIDGEKMVTESQDIAAALEKQMRDDGRTDVADSFAADMKLAKSRDVIVEIEWTGDAGLDVSVREPLDTVCWYFNPRTTSGGVLHDLTNIQSSSSGDRSGKNKITYVCPIGFKGKYEIVVQREWGTVTGSGFKTTITSNYGLPDEKRNEHFFTMGKTATVINLESTRGRRTESLESAKVASAIATQDKLQDRIAINSLLKQMEDRRTTIAAQSDATSSGYTPGGTNVTYPTSQTPAARASYPYYPVYNSVIGYQPQIEMVESGVELSATAVATADRRYVRIMPQPYISAIVGVATFNSVDGEVGGLD